MISDNEEHCEDIPVEQGVTEGIILDGVFREGFSEGVVLSLRTEWGWGPAFQQRWQHAQRRGISLTLREQKEAVVTWGYLGRKGM